MDTAFLLVRVYRPRGLTVPLAITLSRDRGQRELISCAGAMALANPTITPHTEDGRVIFQDATGSVAYELLELPILDRCSPNDEKKTEEKG